MMKMKLNFVRHSLINPIDVDDGPKKPNQEFNSSKVISGAACTYIAQDLNFSPEIKND
jgi:hypothetical protein